MRHIFIILTIILNFIGDYAEATQICLNEVNRTFENTAKEFKDKFNLEFSRTATDNCHGNDENVKRISLYFNYPKALTQENARALLFDVLNLSLEKINQDTQLQKYLFEHPFKRENLHITIYMPSSIFTMGKCAIMGWDNKAFYYMKNGPSRTIKEESYNEVLQLIQSNKK